MSVVETEALLHAAPALPGLRLLAAPLSEPPYDDELPLPATLRLVPAPVERVPVDRAPRETAPVAPAPLPLDDGPTARTPSSALPSSRPFAHALVQRLLEVCAGVRPVSQLQRDTTPDLFAELEAVLVARPRQTGLRPTRRDVRSVHVQEHEEGVAEVCATVRRGGRVTALALRLEGVDGGWRCTALLGL